MQESQHSLAVVGAGLTGITAALSLSEHGFAVSIYEKEDHIGGLSAAYHWQNIVCDRFYHVILPQDTLLLQLIAKLGLEERINWKKTFSGFYGEGKLVSLSSVSDFIRFPFLSLFQKFRLGLGVLYASRLKKSDKLATLSAPDWLKQIYGKGAYQRVWEPLLYSKLGAASHRFSAVYIWATISRLYAARRSQNKQERMGQVQGGYDAILSVAESRLIANNVHVVTGTEVKKLDLDGNGHVRIHTQSEIRSFDRVLLTLPAPEVLRLIPSESEDASRQKLDRVEYLGIVCLLLILRKSLSRYYVINLLEKNVPFTGIIETTNVIPREYYGGYSLVYLPKYAVLDDPIFQQPDEQIQADFKKGLRSVFPGFEEEDIVHQHVFREPYVQPVLTVDDQPDTGDDFRTSFPGVFVANSSDIHDAVLNNNEAVRLGQKVSEAIILYS